MKKMVLTRIALTLAGVIATAGLTPGTARANSTPISPGLTSAQNSELAALTQQAHIKSMAILNNSSLSDSQRLDQFEQVHQWLQAQKLAILTPKQRSVVLSRQRNAQSQLQQLKTLTAQLRDSLSGTQNEQIAATFQKLQSQTDVIEACPSWTRAQKTQKLVVLGTDSNRQIIKLLTPQQVRIANNLDAVAGRMGGRSYSGCGIEPSVSCLSN